jgi:hypothetical protein
MGNAGIGLGALHAGDLELAVTAVPPYLTTADRTPLRRQLGGPAVAGPVAPHRTRHSGHRVRTGFDRRRSRPRGHDRDGAGGGSGRGGPKRGRSGRLTAAGEPSASPDFRIGSGPGSGTTMPGAAGPLASSPSRATALSSVVTTSISRTCWSTTSPHMPPSMPQVRGGRTTSTGPPRATWSHAPGGRWGTQVSSANCHGTRGSAKGAPPGTRSPGPVTRSQATLVRLPPYVSDSARDSEAANPPSMLLGWQFEVNRDGREKTVLAAPSRCSCRSAWRRMRDSNSRGVAPNTLSKRAP